MTLLYHSNSTSLSNALSPSFLNAISAQFLYYFSKKYNNFCIGLTYWFSLSLWIGTEWAWFYGAGPCLRMQSYLSIHNKLPISLYPHSHKANGRTIIPGPWRKRVFLKCTSKLITEEIMIQTEIFHSGSVLITPASDRETYGKHITYGEQNVHALLSFLNRNIK